MSGAALPLVTMLVGGLPEGGDMTLVYGQDHAVMHRVERTGPPEEWEVLGAAYAISIITGSSAGHYEAVFVYTSVDTGVPVVGVIDDGDVRGIVDHSALDFDVQSFMRPWGVVEWGPVETTDLREPRI